MKCVCDVSLEVGVHRLLHLTGMCFYPNLSELPFSMAIALLCLMRLYEMVFSYFYLLFL